MLIHTCDICKKKIKLNESIDVRLGYTHYELCQECSEPILKFLQKTKLITKKEFKKS